MNTNKKNNKWFYIALGVIQLFIAIGALPAGLLYITDPSGTELGVSTDMLANSPLPNFLIPGLCLFIIHGLGNLAASVFSFLRKPVSGYLGVFFGAAQLIWITVQVSWIGLISFMQPMFFIIGAAETALGIMIYRKTKSTPLQ